MLVLHARRAEKWQFLVGAWNPFKHRLFCPSKNTWGNGAKGKAELTPATNLQWERDGESQGTNDALVVQKK